MGEFAAGILNALVESNIADVKSIRDIQLSGTASIRAVVEVTDEATAISIEEAASQGMCVALDGMAYCTDGTSFKLESIDNSADGADAVSPDEEESSSSSSGSMSTGAIAGLAVLVVLVAVLIAVVAVKRSQKAHRASNGGLDGLFEDYNSGTGNSNTTAYMAYLKSMSAGGAAGASNPGTYERAAAEGEHSYEDALAGADVDGKYEMALLDRPDYDMGDGTAGGDGYDQANHGYYETAEDDAESQVQAEDLTYDPMTTQDLEQDAQSVASNPGFASNSSSPPSLHEDEDPAILDQQRALSSSNQGSVRSELYTANVPTMIPPTPPPMPPPMPPSLVSSSE